MVPCPFCSALSSRVHGYYTRTVADLPWAGVPIQLQCTSGALCQATMSYRTRMIGSVG